VTKDGTFLKKMNVNKEDFKYYQQIVLKICFFQQKIFRVEISVKMISDVVEGLISMRREKELHIKILIYSVKI